MKRKALGKIIHSKPDVIIGKNGINSSIKKEVERQFEKKKSVKVKILDPEVASRTTFEILAKNTNTKIRDIRGKTCVLQRLKKKSKSSEKL